MERNRSCRSFEQKWSRLEEPERELMPEERILLELNSESSFALPLPDT